MRKLREILSNPLCIGAMAVRRYLKSVLNDRTYLRLLYFFEQGRPLHLKNPETFTEKIQWLKLNDRKPLYTKMVDKIEVKGLIRELVGDEYIIPTIGCWDSFDDVDFDSLPDQFVLKSTNGSGGCVVICKDKAHFDISEAKRVIESTAKGNVGVTYREWPYLDIKPRIFAEELITNPDSEDLTDYKFFCFNGRPLYCQVIANRRSHETIDFYDRDWKHQEFFGLNPSVNPSVNPSGIILPKPENFALMLQLAEIISKGHIFLRVDLYNVRGKIYFGETTFYPASGFGRFQPAEWDLRLGGLIELPR